MNQFSAGKLQSILFNATSILGPSRSLGIEVGFNAHIKVHNLNPKRTELYLQFKGRRDRGEAFWGHPVCVTLISF